MGTKFGSTRKLASGRIQARYTGPDGNRYKAPSTFADELSALAWLASVRKAIDLGTWEPPTVEPAQVIPTVGEMVQHWLDSVKLSVRTSTHRKYVEIVSGRILGNERLCAVQVDKLTPAMVGVWWQETTKAFPESPYRNHAAYTKLRTCIGIAVEYGYIQSNPVIVRAASKRPQTKRKDLPATAELKAILAHVPARYKLVTVLCLFHGLRVGEALAIKTGNITVEGSQAFVKVEGTLARVPNGAGGMMMELHPPKTMAGYRTVPILPEFVNYVAEHLRRFGTAPQDFATLTDKGCVVFDTSYRSIFHRARKAAGVDKTITPHYGRNYLITRLAEAGATPKEIGRILGQEDTSTIVDTYMKVREHRPVELMLKVNLSD